MDYCRIYLQDYKLCTFLFFYYYSCAIINVNQNDFPSLLQRHLFLNMRLLPRGMHTMAHYSTPIANQVYWQNVQTFSCLQWTNQTKVIKIAQHNKCFKWFPNSIENATLNDFCCVLLKNDSIPSWQTSLVLSRTPFYCYDLLQSRCIARHQLLGVLLESYPIPHEQWPPVQ